MSLSMHPPVSQNTIHYYTYINYMCTRPRLESDVHVHHKKTDPKPNTKMVVHHKNMKIDVPSKPNVKLASTLEW